MEKLAKEVRFLKLYAFTLTILLVAFVLFSFRQGNGKQKFEEIDVERINVKEKDGTLKLVIANSERQHPGLVDGKEISPRPRPAGMVFFNESGDECGGLVYSGNKKEAGMVYSVDQYRNDQIMQLQYSQAVGTPDKNRSYGLKLWDRSDDFPLSRQIQLADSLQKMKDQAAAGRVLDDIKKKGLLGAERLFVGKTAKDEVGLFIRDDKGVVRIRIAIDKDNKALIETFDENGKSFSH